MNVNMIVSATAVLVGLMVGLVFYLQSQSDDASYLVKSKWSVTTADGTAQTWLIDSESGAISIRSAYGSTAHVQEFFGGKAYTYTTDHQLPETESVEEAGAKFCAPITHGMGDFDGDCEVFFKEHHSTIANMAETFTGTKHLCSSTDSGSLSATTISSDGNLSVGGFIVSMVNGSPSAILDHAGNSMATINSFEDVEEVKLTGCDTSEEATYLDAIANVADSRRKLGEVDAEVMKARELVNDIILMNVSGDIEAEARRHLKVDVTDSEGGSAGSGITSILTRNDTDKKTEYNTYRQNGLANHNSVYCENKTVQGGSFHAYGKRASDNFLKDYGSDDSTAGKKVDVTGLETNFETKAAMRVTQPRFTYGKGSQLCQGVGNKKLHRSQTNTNWCGEFSNREHTPCPNIFTGGAWSYYTEIGINSSPWKNAINKYDWWTDGACRRHDHGIRFDYIKGGVRLGCRIDNDLVQKSKHNGTVMSIFSDKWSFASLPGWGCYHLGERYYWQKTFNSGKWVRVLKSNEEIRFGWGRYSHLQWGHHYGYTVPFRYCKSDTSNKFKPNYPPSANYWWENNFTSNFPNHPTKDGFVWHTKNGHYVKTVVSKTTATSGSKGGTGSA